MRRSLAGNSSVGRHLRARTEPLTLPFPEGEGSGGSGLSRPRDPPLLPQEVDERLERGGDLPPARVVEVEAGQARGPILEQADKAPRANVWGDELPDRIGDADAVEGGTALHGVVVDDQVARDGDFDFAAGLLERPRGGGAARKADADAVVRLQVLRLHRPGM